MAVTVRLADVLAAAGRTALPTTRRREFLESAALALVPGAHDGMQRELQGDHPLLAGYQGPHLIFDAQFVAAHLDCSRSGAIWGGAFDYQPAGDSLYRLWRQY